MELTPEEESSLLELVRCHESGGDPAEFIGNRLYKELSHVTGRDGLNNEIRELDPGYRIQEQAYEGLAAKGMIDAVRLPHCSGLRYRGLTSEGRCYFDMKKARKKARRAEVWSERRFTLFMCLLTFLLGLLSSWIISNQVVERSLQSLLGS